MTPDPVSEQPPWKAAFLVGAGLVTMTLAAFATPAVIQILCINYHHDAYKPDHFRVEYYNTSGGETSFGGAVVSTDEKYTDDSATLIGDPDFVRKLDTEMKMEGYVAPILYISQNARGIWSILDFFNRFRIIRPDQFDAGAWPTWLAVVSFMWWGGIASFRKGVKAATAHRGTQRIPTARRTR